MKAEIKWFEYGSTMEDYFMPDNLEQFVELVTMKIGPENFDGGDYFYCHIVTARFLMDVLKLNQNFNVEWGRHQLIVPYWNQLLIEHEFKTIVSTYGNGDNWVSIAKKLSNFFQWEFEDYQVVNSKWGGQILICPSFTFNSPHTHLVSPRGF